MRSRKFVPAKVQIKGYGSISTGISKTYTYILTTKKFGRNLVVFRRIVRTNNVIYAPFTSTC